MKKTVKEPAKGSPQKDKRVILTGVFWVMLIYIGSGVCSLIDQVVWVRLLKLTLGNTVYASSVVVSVFLGGLALGGLVMGMFADSIKRRLRLYAILELFTALSALAVPWALKVADGVYGWFFVKLHTSPTALLFVQVLVSAAILLVPTMLMGSTLPLLGRYVTALEDRVGRLVGRLYALNMLGATAGCFLAGFVLIRTLGVMGTLYAAAAVNLLIALGGWILSRYYDTEVTPSPEAQPREELRIVRVEASGSRPLMYLLALAFFASGFISVGYEIIWMRSIVFLWGGYTYIFSAVLTIYLLGNVIGVWFGSLLSKYLKRPAAWFGASLTCLGIFGILYIPWLYVWSKVGVIRIIPHLGMSHMPSVQWQVTAFTVINCLFLFLLPSIIMGVGFPLALQVWGAYRHRVGETTGTVYGVNTIGCVIGGVIAGFVFIPFLGVQFSVTLFGLAGIWFGGVIMQMFSGRLILGERMGLAAVAFVLTIIAFMVPSSMFERQFVKVPKTELIEAKEGVTTTASVHRGVNGDLTLVTSGIRVAGDERDAFRIPQKILGHLGLLLNGNPTEAVTVGYGSGETAFCMSRHDLTRLEGIEIASELVELSQKYFKHINIGDSLHEKVTMIYMDGKNYIHLTDKTYDLITNDAINPREVAENASLFTKEYFEDALKHLKPGGMFGTYLPVKEMPISCTNSILGTFTEVFPYVTIWFPVCVPSGYDFWYIVGSREPQIFSPSVIDRALQKEGIRNSVNYVNFLDSRYVLSCYIGDQDDLKRYLGSYELNSDFHPYVEFSTDIKDFTPYFDLDTEVFKEDLIEKKKWFDGFIDKVRRDNSLLKHIDLTGLSQEEKDAWLRDYPLFYRVSSYLILQARGGGNLFQLLLNNFDCMEILPRHNALYFLEDQYLTTIRKNLRSPKAAQSAMQYIDRMLKERPEFGAAWLLRSIAMQLFNDWTAAMDAGEKAVRYGPYSVHARNNLGVMYLRTNEGDKALAQFNEGIRLNPQEPSSYYNLGLAHAQHGRFDDAVTQFTKVLELQPGNAEAHCRLGDIYAMQGRKEQAAAEFREALRINPEHREAKTKLNNLFTQ